MDRMDEIVVLKQEPVIAQHLEDVNDYITATVSECHNLEPTVDTLTACKGYRAGLNRFRKELETQRKAVKDQCLAPYREFEARYKALVLDPMDEAEAVLSAKIAEVEGSLKGACEDRLRSWFDELKTANDLPWLEWSSLGITVDLTSAKARKPTRLMNEIEAKVQSIRADVDAIYGMDNAPEVMAEYRQNLNLAQSIATVKDRADRVQVEMEERERVLAARHEEDLRISAMTEEVNAFSPPEEERATDDAVSSGDEELLEVTFTVTDTRKRLIALREWMKENGYVYQ